MHDDQQPSLDKSGMLAEKFMNIHVERIESVEQLIGKLPKEGDIIFLWTINSFTAFTFIPFIIKQCGIIEELILSTYSINIRIIDSLIHKVDQGKIRNVEIFINDSIQARLPKVYDHLISLVEKYPVKVHYAWNHSKISLIRTKDNYFDVEGSGNWGENAQHEQYVFINSKRVYEFRKSEILTCIDSRAVSGC